MSQKMQLLSVLLLCALSLYTDAMEDELIESMLNRTPNRKRIFSLTEDEQAGISRSSGETDKKGKKPTSVAQNVQQPATPDINEASTEAIELETAVAEPEELDLKGQAEQLLQMRDTLIWEMAVRSDVEQTVDLDGDLDWFQGVIFEQFLNFLKNIPADLKNDQKTIELAKHLANWYKSDKKVKLPVNNEMAQVEEMVQRMSAFCDQLGESFKGTPAFLDIVLEFRANIAHEKEMNEFLWKMVLRKETHYVKNVGQFFGSIEISRKYLKRAQQIGQWARGLNYISDDQLETLVQFVRSIDEDLVFLLRSIEQKLGVDVKKMGMDEEGHFRSFDNHLVANLATDFVTEAQEIAELEELPIHTAHFAGILLVVALNVAADEINGLKDDLLGMELNWMSFQAVGRVTKMANVLEQIRAQM